VRAVLQGQRHATWMAAWARGLRVGGCLAGGSCKQAQDDRPAEALTADLTKPLRVSAVGATMKLGPGGIAAVPGEDPGHRQLTGEMTSQRRVWLIAPFWPRPAPAGKRSRLSLAEARGRLRLEILTLSSTHLSRVPRPGAPRSFFVETPARSSRRCKNRLKWAEERDRETARRRRSERPPTGARRWASPS
jgi:hypothetical protein